MTENDLLAIIRAHRDDSLGAQDSELSSERASALDHYHGRPYGNEVEGRSAVVDRTVAEAVDWAMPAIMRAFTQSGLVAEFAPVGPEDEEGAHQESFMVNHVMMRENDGFMVMHDAIKDALILKNGYTKQIWEQRQEIEEESYTGLTTDQAALLLQKLEQKGKVEVIGSEPRMESIPSPIPTIPAVEVTTWDIKVRITQEDSRAVWVAVPAEEIRVSKRCRGTLRDSPFTEHVTKKSRSDLIELGMPAEFVYSLPAFSESESTSTRYARDTVDDESDDNGHAADRAMDEIEYCEAYLRVDFDGDGIAELRKVVTAGGKIPPGEQWNEQISCVPIAAWIVKRVPHRHVGESLDDELADFQEIMTVLKRQLLDNIYQTNHAETVINVDYANPRDFMTRTPSGVKRISGTQPASNVVMPLVTKPIIGEILPVLQWMHGGKHERSGISGPNTGVDPDVLQQTTKGAFLENMMKASQKLEMIIRMLAETGVKESVLQIHAMLMRNQNVPKLIEMRGNWTPVNPREWKARNDLTVRVGLGTGSEDDKRQKLGVATQLQGQLLQMVMQAPLQVYEKAYSMWEDTAKTLGIDNPGKYAIAPRSPEHMQLMQQAQMARQQAQQQGGEIAAAAQIQAKASMQIEAIRMRAKMEVEAAEQLFKREKEALLAQLNQRSAEEDRRLAIILERMKQDGLDRRAAMSEEAGLIKEGMAMDLGAPGISAGVQGAPGVMPPPIQGDGGLV